MTHYYAMMDTEVIEDLGDCESFDEAFDKAEKLGENHHWIFDQRGLLKIQESINSLLSPVTTEKEDAHEIAH